MNTCQKRTSPAGTGLAHRKAFSGTDSTTALRALYGASKAPISAKRLPVDWRDRLPDPASYYAQHVKLTGPNSSGYAQGRCPFHDDHNASLSVHVIGRGLWKCFASCGGGDMVGFHMRLTGKAFRDAVCELIGSRP